MIPQQIPVKNHYGNNSATVFDFDFLIENENQIIVTHTDLDSKETILQYGVDYELNTNSIGGSITFPLKGSEYPILQWNTQNNDREILSIALALPIEQPAEYNDSSELNLENMEYSFDYITRILQILARQLDMTMKFSEGSNVNLRLPQPKANNVFKWNEDATALENYDIIGENNTFKSQLISDIEVAQSEMNDTIVSNKINTDKQLSDFEILINSEIENISNIANTTLERTATSIETNKADTDKQISEFKKQVNVEIEAISSTANDTLEKATTVISYAISAISIANESLEKSNTADEKATNANLLSNNANTKADSAIVDSSNAISKSQEALSNSQSALSLANESFTIADSANKTSATAKEIAEGIDAKATEALSTSSLANTTANSANSIANNAYSEASNARIRCDEIIAKIGTALKIKGRVEVFDNLPKEDNLDGDTYLVGEEGLESYPEYYWFNDHWEFLGTSGSGGAWGTITGDITNQTDLQNALKNAASIIIRRW